MVLALANFAPREDGPRDRPFNEWHSSVFTACVSLSMWSLETALRRGAVGNVTYFAPFSLLAEPGAVRS